MDFIIEDGTGIEGATSLCSVETADDYAPQHPHGAAWLALVNPGTGEHTVKQAWLMALLMP